VRSAALNTGPGFLDCPTYCLVRALREKLDGVSAGADAEDFVLTVTDVFSLTGRGTAVIGRIESGVIRTGETVEIWDGGRLIAAARATVELICSRRHDPASIGLLLGDMDKSLLRSGQAVRRLARAEPHDGLRAP
jgi:elongation factor Tu